MATGTRKAATLAAALAFLVLTGAPAARAVEYQLIATLAEFNQKIVGKTLTLRGDTLLIRRDGTLRGTRDGRAFAGRWEWRDGYWCRDLTDPAGDSDCMRWESRFNKYRATPDRGRGKGIVYTEK